MKTKLENEIISQLDNFSEPNFHYLIIKLTHYLIKKNERYLHSYSILQTGLPLLRLSFFDFYEEERRYGFGFSQRNYHAQK